MRGLFNASLGHDLPTSTLRKQSAEALIEKHCDLQSLDSVLDYGGDEGQFIPDRLGRHKFVFELSAAPPLPSVTKISSEAALDANRFEPLMISNVLEHGSSPADTH